MIKQLILENWKSFRHAVLDIDPLTVMIGTNASGKSNAIEALEFLKRTAEGRDIQTALEGYPTLLKPIRGGAEWAALKPETQFTLKVLLQGRNENKDYFYSITIETKPHLQVYGESLVLLERKLINSEFNSKETLFETEHTSSHNPSIKVRLYSPNTERDLPLQQEFTKSQSILSQIKGISMKIVESINIVSDTLKSICILDPIPSNMRSYSLLSDKLLSDTSNIAGVLAALPDEKKDEIESIVSTYVRDLPERDIQRVWAETVGRFKSDAMLYCEEIWKPSEVMVIDARGMSDGTLRFIGIITAILTYPKGSQLIIEDVDNGLHPSRSDLLVKMLREIGEKRKIDILITTHNPALLDALGPEIVPFVVVAHRDDETGESKLTLLEDMQNFSKLFASASLGKLTTNGAIERSLSRTN